MELQDCYKGEYDEDKKEKAAELIKKIEEAWDVEEKYWHKELGLGG